LLFGIALLLFSSTVNAALTQSDLCGQWIQTVVASNNKTCVQNVGQCGCSGSCPRVTQLMNFYTDSLTYTQNTTAYGSSSCKSNELYQVVSGGTYSLGSDTVSNWTGVTYTPTWFKVTPYTSGMYPYDAGNISNCTDLLTYLNASCPCNGTWTSGVARNITLDQCNGTCSDTTIFDTRKQYGNLQRLENDTAGTLYLLITFTFTNQSTGFANTTVNFYQKPGCGTSCKSCLVTPSGPSNCTACCSSHSMGQLNGACTCNSGYKDESSNPFQLKCMAKSGASQIYSVSSFVYILLALVCFSSNA
jgi:hypothetical protein